MFLPLRSAMARSASEGVETSTKAYPTGRVVRGLVGIEVVSLEVRLAKGRHLVVSRDKW